MISRTLPVIILVLLLCASAQPQVYDWTNYTNKDEIKSLTAIGGDVWATTTGGLVRINASTSAVRTYIKSDGLGSTDLSFVTYAGDSIAYVGSSDGVLSKFEIESGTFTNYYFEGRDGANIELYNADTSAGYLWIGSNIGIIKFDRVRNGGEVKEIYRTLGTFSTELPVNDVAIFNDRIYAATPEGLAYANVTNPYLLDPTEWRSIESAAEIELTSLLTIDSLLWIGSTNGLFFLSDEDTALTSRSSGLSVRNMTPAGYYLYVVVEDSLVFVDSHEINRVTLTDVPTEQLSCAVYESRLFVGTTLSGVYRLLAGSSTRIPVPGPTSNDVIGGGVSGEGYLYAVSRQGDVARMKDDVWQSVSTPNVEKISTGFGTDSSLWIGTFGQSAIQLLANGTRRTFNGTNSPLTGPNYYSAEVAVVNGIATDLAGRIWFSSYQASPMRPLVMFDPHDSAWTYFDRSDGVTDSNVTCVAAGIGAAALGTQNLGVMYVRYGADPFNHSDDTLKYYSRSVLLPSATVNAMTFDLDNFLWVGTPLGLAYFDAEIEFFTVVSLPDGVSSDVRALTTDSRNNLWVGTADGLAFISAGQTQKVAFNTENSELLSNEIQSLSFDSTTGRLLVFTKGGLSLLDYTLGPVDSIKTVYPYPNPFVIQIGVDATLQFKYTKRAEVRIFTVAGELVRKIEVSDGWDGKNDSGELVTSGIYIYHLLGEDKTQHTGKIFVLRK
jgi:ligand-binding sensor domain-containing protein